MGKKRACSSNKTPERNRAEPSRHIPTRTTEIQARVQQVVLIPERGKQHSLNVSHGDDTLREDVHALSQTRSSTLDHSWRRSQKTISQIASRYTVIHHDSSVLLVPLDSTHKGPRVSSTKLVWNVRREQDTGASTAKRRAGTRKEQRAVPPHGYFSPTEAVMPCH